MRLALLALLIAGCSPASRPANTPNTGVPPSAGQWGAKQVKKAGSDPEATDASSLGRKRVAPDTVPADVRAKAEVIGYGDLLAAFKEPDEAAKTGAFHESGWRAAGPYQDEGPTPGGHWVYSAPYWLVYRLHEGKEGG